MSTNRLLEIDFIKGIAIASVILLHTLSAEIRTCTFSIFHIGQAVPIFIAITFFLSFRILQKDDGTLTKWYSQKRICNILRRIILPVLVINILQVIAMLLFNRKDLIIKVVWGGGYGPGSYYLWVYLQLWVLMPFLYRLMNSGRKYCGILIMLLICFLLNILMNKVSLFVEIPNRVNSMLCFRYLFLASIAWIWIHRHAYNKYLVWGGQVISFCYLLYVYLGNDVKPLIHPGTWLSQNYPVYFWTFLLIQLLWRAYGKIGSETIKHAFCWMGRNSWEIFVLQMFFLGFIKIDTCCIFPYPAANQLFYVLVGFTLSLFPVVVYKSVMNNLFKR